MIKKFLLFIFFLLILLFCYQGLSFVYFQQDEFYTIGKTIFYLNGHFLDIFTRHFAFHYIPLASIYFLIQYAFFHINASFYLYLGVVLQAICGVLLFIVFRNFFTHITSIILASMFVVSGEIYQVIINEMVSYYTLSLIIVLSLFIYLKKHMNPRATNKDLFISLPFLMGAIFLNEIWLSLIIIIPTYFFIFYRNLYKRFLSRRLTVFIVVVVLIIILRLILEKILPFDSVRPIAASPIVSAAYNVATLPLKLSIQYLFQLPVILNFAQFYAEHISYFRTDVTINSALISITLGYDIIVFYLGALCILIASILFLLNRSINEKKYYGKIICFGIIWVIIMSILLAPQNRFFTSVESRYLYLPSVGILFVIGGLVEIIWKTIKNKLGRVIYISIILVMGVTWFFLSYQQIQNQLTNVKKVSVIRKSILEQIKHQVPILPMKTIVYIYCSDMCANNSTLGMPANWIVPFQNGFGWNLLILYSQDSPQIYAPFFENSYLWERGDVGYKEIGKYGFGYITDSSKLKGIMQQYHLNSANLINFEYNSKNNIIRLVKNKKIVK